MDPELGRAIGDHDRLDRAIGAITGTYVRFEAGGSRELTLALEDTRLGVLVLDGFMVNEVTIAGRTTADLVGPEDLIRAGATAADASMLPRADSWSALTPVRLAMLDETFTQQASAWPEIVAALLERATRRGSRLVVGQAIRTLPSIDVRLLAFLWHLAAHWGVVLPRGVVIEAPVSHERLGRLIGSRRPTVTASVGRLRAAGLIEQREDGSWLVLGSLFSEGGVEDRHAISGLEEMLLPSALGVRRRGLRRRAGPVARHGGAGDLRAPRDLAQHALRTSDHARGAVHVDAHPGGRGPQRVDGALGRAATHARSTRREERRRRPRSGPCGPGGRARRARRGPRRS